MKEREEEIFDLKSQLNDAKNIKINSECMDLSFDKIHPMLSKKLASFSNLDNIQLI